MSAYTGSTSISIRDSVDVRLIIKTLRASIKVAAASLILLAVVSLVPSDEAYYRAEYHLSRIGPLGSASQHLRSIPATLSSIILEFFQGHSLEVEGVKIDVTHAVNPTQYVEEGHFPSRELGEDRTYWIYLPPGYEDSEEQYPTLYLLHGMSQDQRWWTEVARIDRITTAMIVSDKIRPLIVVMPNGNRVEGDVSTTSLYDDHCETGLDFVARALKIIGDRLRSLRVYKISCEGDFEDYIVSEVVTEIDSRYRTNGERYIGGFSVGGRGAVQLALGNDGFFDGAFGLSGNYDFLRKELRDGDIQPGKDIKLFLASGDKDQRGVYGELNTFLFHKELKRQGMEHLYCTYDGTHSDMAWVAAMPQALQYLLATEDPDLQHTC